MARYSKTKPRKSLKTLQDKEFDRLKTSRSKVKNKGAWGTEKMRGKHWKMWKKKHDAEVEKKWKEKEAKKRKQVVDTDYLYGDWMKDKKK